MKENEKILAGIVLDNPKIEWLKKNVAAIAPQVERLVFIDNASKNMSDVEGILPANAVVLHNEKDLGIATALNQILQYALDNDYDWALPLAQDTIAPPNMVEAYRKEITTITRRLGIVCPAGIDPISGEIMDQGSFFVEYEYGEDLADECCSICGSIVNVKAWKEVGGFDDSLYVNSGDEHFCVALWRAGWGVYKTIETALYIGDGFVDPHDDFVFEDEWFQQRFDDRDDDEYYDDEYYDERIPSEYEGTYAHDVMGLSDDFIDDVLDGEPDAYWNID